MSIASVNIEPISNILGRSYAYDRCIRGSTIYLTKRAWNGLRLDALLI